jgi:hypothetical protein
MNMHAPKACRLLASLLLACLPLAAMAQLAASDPDWKESPVPPPPAFDQARLVPFDVSATSSLRYGVDAATLKITPDGIVRYVVVATSTSGALNAMYEGVRCATGEVKTYARFNPGSGWKLLANVEWKSLQPGYAYKLARQGLCTGGNAPQPSVDRIVRTLKDTLPESKN